MAMTNEFMEAVQTGNKMRVRIMLKDSLLLDPTSGQFNEMERYAEEEMGNIYDAHDGERLNFDVSSWNEEYLNQQMVAVVTSFSRERIDLLKNMVRYLYKEKVGKIHREETSSYAQGHPSRKQVGAGVTVGGAALTLAGFCTSCVPLTIGGVVVAGVGVAMIAREK
ncbi:MAG: hypothetical protein KH138_06405 [Firmicutes bacterium]|nr:hypothetical protein [Bacillota bacterium]